MNLRHLEEDKGHNHILSFNVPLIDSSNSQQIPNPKAYNADGRGPCAFVFQRHPGFFVIRDALSAVTQRKLAVDCLKTFPSSPAATNFSRTHGRTLDGLWDASQRNERLNGAALELARDEDAGEGDDDDDGAIERRNRSMGDALPLWVEANGSGGDDGPSATHLLRKLRWASIGPVFDWTQRRYLLEDGSFLPLPEYLKELAQRTFKACAKAMASMDLSSFWRCTDGECGRDRRSLDDAVRSEESVDRATFRPDAALINYYSPGDTLGGHVDDAETDLTLPLVSFSVGCPGVFLLGGTSREQTPTAMWLCSGDAVVLLGKARRCFHGVPRVLSSQEYERVVASGCDAVSEERNGAGREEILEISSHGLYSGLEDGTMAEFKPFAEHLQQRRINISVRQVSVM